ncbi:UEV domain-containing protein [Entophlyctis helioformis]|nr:UEV domain-containing protein [Entophlyctis helioformis]
MTSSDTVRSWLRQVLQSYQAPDHTFRDVEAVLRDHIGLGPKTDVYTQDDGRQVVLLCLHGTIQISFNGALYNIPVALWIPFMYPKQAPFAYVVPTAAMVVRTSKHVDMNGRIYHPFLAYWHTRPDASLSAFINVLREVFAAEPPVYSKPTSVGGGGGSGGSSVSPSLANPMQRPGPSASPTLAMTGSPTRQSNMPGYMAQPQQQPQQSQQTQQTQQTQAGLYGAARPPAQSNPFVYQQYGQTTQYGSPGTAGAMPAGANGFYATSGRASPVPLPAPPPALSSGTYVPVVPPKRPVSVQPANAGPSVLPTPTQPQSRLGQPAAVGASTGLQILPQPYGNANNAGNNTFGQMGAVTPTLQQLPQPVLQPQQQKQQRSKADEAARELYVRRSLLREKLKERFRAMEASLSAEIDQLLSANRQLLDGERRVQDTLRYLADLETKLKGSVDVLSTRNEELRKHIDELRGKPDVNVDKDLAFDNVVQNQLS